MLQELQSDADYAEVYTRSKWRQSRWAPSRIQQVSAPQYASVFLGPCTAVDLMFSLHKLGLAKACNPMQLCFCTTNLMQQQSSDIMHCEGKWAGCILYGCQTWSSILRFLLKLYRMQYQSCMMTANASHDLGSSAEASAAVCSMACVLVTQVCVHS